MTHLNKEGLEARLLDIVRADADEAILADNYITLVEAASEMSSLREENKRLRKERDEALAEIDSMTPKFVAYEYLESPAGREIAEAALSASQAQLKIYREALEPFAKIGDAFNDLDADMRPDDRPAWGFNQHEVTYGDFRRAHTALSQNQEQSE